jgi:hypothetical protein
MTSKGYRGATELRAKDPEAQDTERHDEGGNKKVILNLCAISQNRYRLLIPTQESYKIVSKQSSEFKFMRHLKKN